MTDLNTSVNLGNMTNDAAQNFFSGLTAGASDIFASAKSYDTDTRFYTLPKDKDGNGQALIAFLPDRDQKLIQKVFKINCQNVVNGKKRFISTFSPQTIGAPDPFQERWAKLWNEGRQDEARQFARSIKFVTNIKVIKDPSNPENEGKIFLYELSQRMLDKIQAALAPSENDIALGAEKKEVFNPFSQWLFKLVAKRGSNGIITYDNSEFVKVTNSKIYETPTEAINDITTNGHALSWFLDINNYMPYDELQDKLLWIMDEKNKVQNAQNAQNAQAIQVKENTFSPEVQPVQNALNAQGVQSIQPIQQPSPIQPVKPVYPSNPTNNEPAQEKVDVDDVLSQLIG